MGISSRKRALALALLLAVITALSGCARQTVQEQFHTLTQELENQGHAYTLTSLENTGRNVEVPIYNDSVWYSLMLDGEEVLVYFDSSNRAKQLAQQFCAEEEGTVVAYGLRYILLYRGEEESITALLQKLGESAG